MSDTTALASISDAAILIGDPGYHSITIPQWVTFFNKRARQLCTRMNLVKRRALFSTEAANEMYTYPKNLVQMVKLEYTNTPSDATTFRKLREMFSEEFEQATSGQYPTGEPTNYFADQGWFFLYPCPTAFLAQACRITYWGLPNSVVDPNVDLLPFAESMRDVQFEGMLADAYSIMEKYDKAQAQEAKYEALIAQSAFKIEDRSDDRRSRLQTAGRVRGYSGQV